MKKTLFFLILSCLVQSGHCFENVIGHTSNVEVMRRIKDYLPRNPVIIEAGTYDGYDAIDLSKLVPKAQIYALEPVPYLFSNSIKNVEPFSNIKVYNYALSDKTGTATMHLSEWASGSIGMSSSLLAPKEHLKYAPHISFDNKIEVSTITIDDFVEKHNIRDISFLRLDIQGNELNVMMASPKTLKSVKAILTEVEFVEAYEGQYLFEDIKSWLEGQGFELDIVFTDPGRWFGDALFIRKK